MTNKKIPELTAVGLLGGTELFHLVDSDGNSRKVTLDDLKTFINTDPTVVPSSVPYRGALVRRTSALSLAPSTTTPVIFQEELRDTDDFFSLGSPTRLTVPVGVTKVRLKSNVRFASNASGIRYCFHSKNGALFIGRGYVNQAALGAFLTQNFQSAVLDVVEGDYFELNVFQNTTGNLNLDFEDTWFEMEVVEATV